MQEKNYIYYVAINEKTHKVYLGKAKDVNNVYINVRYALGLKNSSLADWLVMTSLPGYQKTFYNWFWNSARQVLKKGNYKIINKQNKIIMEFICSIENMQPEELLQLTVYKELTI